MLLITYSQCRGRRFNPVQLHQEYHEGLCVLRVQALGLFQVVDLGAILPFVFEPHRGNPQNGNRDQR
jgi:hypothetical protein